MEIGFIINDRYEVMELLGQGGMGTVYKVRDFVENRVVALKLIKEQIFSDKAITRFKNEFKLVTYLDHPNIVKVYDLEVYKPSDSYFFTMEFIDGITLGKTFTIFTDREKYDVLIKIARGLNYIHSRHIVHFDIKPDNIFLVKSKGGYDVKIMDFGLATLLEEFSGKVRGTLSYIAPEVMMRGEVDYRADLYSLGMVIYHMFSQKLPFEDFSSIKAIAKAKMDETFLEETAFKNLKDAFLKNLITDLCRAHKEDRIQSAQQLINYFETAIESNIREEDRDKFIKDSLNDRYFDNQNLIATMQDEYLDFCLRGEKRCGKLTLMVGEKGCGKTEFLQNFNIKAQLGRIPVLYIPIKQEDTLVNTFFRKLIFGLISYAEKNEKTKAIFSAAQNLITRNGEFKPSDDLPTLVKNLLRDIFENMSTKQSLVLLVDDILNFSEKDINLFMYTLHLVVVAPIFMVTAVDKDKIRKSKLDDYENVFYLIPPERKYIDNLQPDEAMEFIALLLNSPVENIDQKILPDVMKETSGNISLIKSYIHFLLHNSFLYSAEGYYKYNNYSDLPFSVEIEKIYTDRIINLSDDEKAVLLFIAEKLNSGENITDLGELFGLDQLEHILTNLTSQNLIDFQLERGQKNYSIKNENLTLLIKTIFDEVNMREFYDHFADFYQSRTEKSIVKFTYCYIRSSALEELKIDCLDKAIEYCRYAFKEIDLKNFLCYYYNHFEMPPDIQIKLLKELYLLLIWIGEIDDAFKYYNILYELLLESPQSKDYAVILADAAYFSEQKMPLEERLERLSLASDIFLTLHLDNDYFNVITKYMTLLFRTGKLTECSLFIESEISRHEDIISEKVLSKLKIFLSFLLHSHEISKCEIYNKLLKIYKHLEADYVNPGEDIDLINLTLINQIISGRSDLAIKMTRIYLDKAEAKKNKIDQISLFFIYAYLLEREGRLSEALEVYLKIESVVEKKKGVNGLLSVLIDIISLMIKDRRPPEIIDEEFNKAISISKKLKEYESLMMLYNLLIEFLLFKGEWRDVDINIKFVLNILPKIRGIKTINRFISISAFYYYIIKDTAGFYSLTDKINYTLNPEIKSNPGLVMLIQDARYIFNPTAQESYDLFLTKIPDIDEKMLKMLYFVKYINNSLLNFASYKTDEVISATTNMTAEFTHRPTQLEYLSITRMLFQEIYTQALDATVKLGKINWTRGYVFDCYLPILTSIFYFKNKSMFKKAMFFEEKLDKINTKLASKLPFEKRDNFINKYWTF